MTQEGFISKLTQLLALYVVYVFLSGWTFFDFYYRQFGVDPRWFDLPMQETLVKGFTILFTSGTWLWPFYAAMLVAPLWVDGTASLRDRLWVRLALGLFLMGILPGVYFISRHAGISEAMNDQGSPTRLAPATFSLKSCVERREARREKAQAQVPAKKPSEKNAELPENCDYSGEILIFRNGTYYMYKVAPLREQPPPKTLAVLVYRAEELVNLNIAGQ